MCVLIHVCDNKLERLENIDSLDNEAVRNIASVYANTTGTSSFNNINATNSITAGSIASNNINVTDNITAGSMTSKNITGTNITSSNVTAGKFFGQICSPNGQYCIGIGNDGVIRETNGGAVMNMNVGNISGNLYNACGSAYLILQDDSNLVQYDQKNGGPLWSRINGNVGIYSGCS